MKVAVGTLLLAGQAHGFAPALSARGFTGKALASRAAAGSRGHRQVLKAVATAPVQTDSLTRVSSQLRSEWKSASSAFV